MTDLTCTALSTDIARAYRDGAPDANGMAAERAISDGAGNPCRHCLREIPAGAEMLILAHRPFPEPQPYAETGPIFICAEACPRFEGAGLPPITAGVPDYLIKGYTAGHRIRYGTGAVVPVSGLEEAATAILARGDVAYVHVRSARNNCFQFRIDRG